MHPRANRVRAEVGMTPSRRAVSVVVSAAVVVAMLTGCGPAGTSNPSSSSTPTSASLATPEAVAADHFMRLERDFDARLGVYAMDTGTGEAVAYRPDERFAYASTSKALLGGAILAQASESELSEIVTYTADQLVEYSPVTEQHIDTGMPLREVMAAAIQYSDNTAANLMFDRLGGPGGLSDYLKSIGDTTTAPERMEPELNEATPGDMRDTSTPRALAASLTEIAFGTTLTPERRDIFTELLIGNTTGDNLIRAGAPDGWVVGDKTGSGGYGTRNDIAILWPDTGSPIVLAVLSSRNSADAERDDALIAAAARAAIAALRPDAG